MTLDTSDLRTVMGERAATVTHVPDFAVTAADRGRRTQRRRVVGALSAAAVVVAGILASTTLGVSQHKASIPGHRYGLPEYQNGMRLVTAHEGGTATGLEFDVTLPPTADGKPTYIGFALSCAAPKPVPKLLYLSLDGQEMGGIGGCQTSLKTSDPIFTSWDSVVSFGTVHRVRLYWKDGKARPGSVFLAGVYQAVPLASYVYPSAPSHLLVPETSNEVDGHRAIATLSPQHTSIVIRPKRGITVQLDTTSPGQLELYVNGKRVDTMETWVYTESGALSGPFPLAQLHIKAGEKVTVKVVPIRFSGDTWRLAIADLDKY